MKGSFWLLSAIFSLSLYSCEDDAVKTKANVAGYWSVEKAYRDKRQTSLLGDVFFQFHEDGKMLTNLPNTSEVPTDYEVKGDQLIQKTSPNIVYKIHAISDSTMVLSLEMNNTPFEIHLHKSAGNAAPADSMEMTGDTIR